MKQIEDYVNRVYRFANGDEKEIEELKSEMKSHLLEAVEELKLEGNTEEEAIRIAKERFGGEQVLQSVISELFDTQKKFAKKILYTAISFIFLGIIGLLSFGLLEYQHYQNVENVGNEILLSLGTQTTISDEIKEIIVQSVQDNKFIYGVELSSKNSNSSFEYTEDSTINPLTNRFNTGVSSNDSDWIVRMEISNFDTLAYGSLYSGFVVYWVLFTIWAIINAYHHRRLNAGWIIVFTLLNVVGYLAYIVLKKLRHNIERTE